MTNKSYVDGVGNPCTRSEFWFLRLARIGVWCVIAAPAVWIYSFAGLSGLLTLAWVLPTVGLLGAFAFSGGGFLFGGW